MTAAFVQSQSGETDLGTTATTGSMNTSSGNALLFGIWNDAFAGGSLTSVTDNDGGSSPAQDVSSAYDASRILYIYSKVNVSAKSGYQASAATSLTAYIGITVEEVSGIATSSATDQTAGGGQNTDTVTTGALSQNNEWAYGFAGQAQGNTWSITSAGWTEDIRITAFGGFPFAISGYKYVTDGAAQTYSVTNTGNGRQIAIATYKEAAAGGATLSQRIIDPNLAGVGVIHGGIIG